MKSILFLFSAAIVLAAPPSLRLPETSRPIRYQIALKLDPTQEAYSGTVEIDVEVTKATREIWLNAEGLTVGKASIGGVEAKVETQPHDFAGLFAAKELAPGRTRVRVEFEGKFDSRNSNGIFRMQEGGDWYAYTQFEPIAARAGFPCYDEPGYKVPWQLTLRVPKGMRAAANTPQVGEQVEGEWTAIRFAPSKPMPSYLVAFAVGPFEFVDAGRAGMNKTPLRIITPKGKASEARYAVEITGKVLEELENYFGIPYPYEKLDIIAIPLTFGFGAMENAGLITYARTLLLSPPERENDSFRQGYLSVAAHEIAHQWFGNLVTPEYWDDIWLNEAFASWLEAKITHKMRPEWKRNIEAVEGRNGVMGQDSLVSTRRIRQPIDSNGDIVNAFDGITYTKGASVIGMFEKWMGEQEFRTGVQRYMKQYAWRNATAGMFLDSISSPKGKNVSAAFGTFLNQPGVPLLNVALQCGAGKVALKVEQSRFLPLGSRGDTNQTWQLPFCVSFERNGQVVKQCEPLSGRAQEISLDTNACPAWLNANAEAAGYYRVRYEGDWLKKLVDNGSLSEAETVDLLGNARALAGAGRLPASDILALSKRFAGNPQWSIAGASLELLTSLESVTPDDAKPALARIVRDLFGARARRIGWKPGPGATPLENEERRSLLPTVALLGRDEPLQAEALALARKWLADRSSLPDDLARAVLPVAARRGGDAFYREVLAALKATSDRAQRGVLITALGSTNDPALARESFRLLLDKEVDFREGLPLLFAAMGGSRTRELPYELVRGNYDRIIAIAPGGGSFNFGSVLPVTASVFCEEPKAAEAREFFSSKLQGATGAERSINNAVERIELCAARKKTLEPQVREALRAY